MSTSQFNELKLSVSRLPVIILATAVVGTSLVEGWFHLFSKPAVTTDPVASP